MNYLSATANREAFAMKSLYIITVLGLSLMGRAQAQLFQDGFTPWQRPGAP